jgi:tape measure domain-containing protein
VAVETTTIKVVADTRDAERALGNLTSTLKGLVSVAALGAIAQQFARVADEATNMSNKLRLVTQEGQSSAQLFGLMAKTANTLGAPMKDVSDLFFRIANNTKDLGLAQTDQLRITELLTKGFQLTGLSMGEASGAVVQLGQAFGQGVLRGDELNSVLEQLPMVADAIAVKFGVQRGALKALGEQGRISSKDLADAILASGEALDTAYTRRLPTIQNAFNVLSNTITTLANKADESTGASAAFSYALLILADAVISVYEWFQKWGKVIGFVVEAFLFLYVPIRAAKAAFALLIGPIESIIAAFRTGGSIAGLFGRALAKLEDYIAPVLEPITVLGHRLAKVFAIIAAGATAIGLGSLISGIKELFSEDKTTAAEKYNKKLGEINKRLGVDQIEASKKAKAVNDALTAQQLKDAEAIRKANIDRDISLKTILRDQNASLALGKLESSELQVQTALNDINKQLIREIKDEKGKVIYTTKGLSAEEEKIIRSLIQQNIQNTILRDLKLDANRIQQEANRLDILNLDLREQQAAVDSRRLQFGQLFTAEMEAQTRAMVAQQQATRNMLAVEQARRALAGTQTFGESVQRGTGVQQRMNPQGSLDTEYKMDMDALKVHLDNKLIAEEDYQRQLARLKREYATRSNEIYIQQIQTERDQRQISIQAEQQRLGKTQQQAKDYAEFMMKTEIQKTQFAIESAGQMFSALGAQNKKAFEAAKAFNIANAIMNTYMAATKAMASYPFPFSLIAAGAAVAMGLAQVAQIRSQQYSGRALGGPVMGGQTYMVGESGPELFTPNTTGSITRNSDLGGGGAVNVTFNIQANDTAGFDDLLLSRRGLIRSVISDAMLESGRRG